MTIKINPDAWPVQPRGHLFDIDLKVQWTIKQSTLAAIIITFIFLISEGADRLFSAELGNWAGLIAAAVVVFFLAPLQRFAENVASVAMPNTRNTPEYAMFHNFPVVCSCFVFCVRARSYDTIWFPVARPGCHMFHFLLRISR